MNIEERKFERAADEMISDDELRVSHMLNGLNRAEAPGNFELHVRGRIAKGQPEESHGGRLFPALRFAAPAVLGVAAVGFLGFGGMFSSGPETTAPVASRASEPAAEVPRTVEQAPLAQAPQSAAAENLTADVTSNRAVVPPARRQAQSGQRISVRAVEASSGGSRDSALKGTNNVLLPRGLDPQPLASPPDLEGFQTSTTLSAAQVLSLIGIESELVNDRWVVKSAKEDTLAHRSGLKTGDVVQSMDGRAVKGDTIFKGSFDNKSVTVLRDGKPVVVQLRAQ